MNANELLTLLGLAWSRLVIYPGGLALIGLIWLITRTENGHPQGQPRSQKSEARSQNRESSTQSWFQHSDNGSWWRCWNGREL